MQKTAIGAGRCLPFPLGAVFRKQWRKSYPGQSGCLIKTWMVMKLTIVLLTAAFIQVHASGVAQNVTIRGQQLSMKNMVAAIEKQTGYVVFCNQEVMALIKPVSINAYRMPLVVFLNSILADQPVDFFIKDKTIVLFEKKAPP